MLHGDASVMRALPVSPISADGGIGPLDDVCADALTATGLPQLPQNRSPGSTAPPQVGHVEVEVGVILEVRQSATRARSWQVGWRFLFSVTARPGAQSHLLLIRASIATEGRSSPVSITGATDVEPTSLVARPLTLRSCRTQASTSLFGKPLQGRSTCSVN